MREDNAEWQHWRECVPSWKYPKEQERPKFAQLVIPTLDSVRYEKLLTLAYSVQKVSRPAYSWQQNRQQACALQVLISTCLYDLITVSLVLVLLSLLACNALSFIGLQCTAGISAGWWSWYSQDFHHQSVPVTFQPRGGFQQDHHLLIPHHASDFPDVS